MYATEALEGHFYLLLISYYLLLITYHLLLITYHLLLITYYLLLITYHIIYTRQKKKRTTTIFPLSSPFNMKMLINMKYSFLIKSY